VEKSLDEIKYIKPIFSINKVENIIINFLEKNQKILEDK
jgi:hypothetical protein